MKLKKIAGVVALASGLMALSTIDAAAQAPTLSVTSAGNSVTIEWTGVFGAIGYNLQAGTSAGSANIASVNLPASITRLVIAAPNGVYFLRVRATAGTLLGPFSNEAVANVGGGTGGGGGGGGPCTPPTAPTVTADVQGGSVTINWTGVAGAQGYRIELSRTPGGVEAVFTQGPSNSFQRYIGMLGRFYVRVVAGNACGTATSAEISFTITTLSGTGPRTPDPPPGQLLPMPGYAAAVVEEIGRRYPGDLAAHSGPACKAQNQWLFKLVRELRLRDSRWGLNYKRGWRGGEFSTDIITYNGTAGPDNSATHIYLADVLSAECEANIPVFNWERVTQETWRADRENPGACGNSDCAAWTIDPYLRAGFPPDGRPQQ